MIRHPISPVESDDSDIATAPAADPPMVCHGESAACYLPLASEIVWHEIAREFVAELLSSNFTSGLSQVEVDARLKRFGRNEMSSRPRMSEWKRFALQFAQPLMYILLVAAAVTCILGEYLDSAVIFGVAFINALVGFLQESKAEKAIEALSKMVRTEATVRRDGRKKRIDSTQLVPGDIVLLQSGDRVPADIRLFHVRSLQVDESALTGESLPIEKHALSLARETVLGDRKNLVFAGTLVTYGQGEGLVWGTGNATETGRIARLIDDATNLTTPLTRKIAEFSRIVLWVILGLAALTFAIGVARGERAVEMFVAAVALAVGAIPEGLPAAVTITLAIGVARMAKRRAIIRKLPAVEALGSTTVICSDKTGTLTENAMTVQRVFTGGRYFEITGAGYEPRGEVLSGEQKVSLVNFPALQETLLAGILNNDSQLVRDGPRFKVEGDPTEAALLIAAEKAGLQIPEALAAHPRLDVIPFESEHQFMATLHGRGESSTRVIYKKGSIECLLERCSHALGSDGEVERLDTTAVSTAVEQMAAKGLRVLAFARREVGPDHCTLQPEHVRSGLTFLGLQGMIDPPRAAAIASVRKCQTAGVQVKMITGDHAITACAIAQQLGLQSRRGEALVAVTGRDLEQVSDADLPAVAERTAVFARVAPEQKLKLVRALQTRGHIVAMTGDGVNDAPALKQADIGVAMGVTGTDVAKGAADILLTDDDFTSIEAAIEEGRSVFDNLTKFIIWTLPTNVGEAAILLFAIVIGTALPALPVHLLWVNMMSAICLGLMLVFEPKERDLMTRPPRDPRTPILTPPLIWRTLLVTMLIVAGAFGAFLWEMKVRGLSVVEARTTVINVIVMVEIFYLLNCRSLLHSMFRVGLWSNLWIYLGIASMLLAQWLFTHTAVMNRLFHTAPLDLLSWAYILAVGCTAYVVIEFEKWVRRRLARRAFCRDTAPQTSAGI